MLTFEKIKAMSDEELMARDSSGKFVLSKIYKGRNYFSTEEKREISRYLTNERGLFLGKVEPPDDFFKERKGSKSKSSAARVNPVLAYAGEDPSESTVAKSPSGKRGKKAIIITRDFFDYNTPSNIKKFTQVDRLMKEGFDVFYMSSKDDGDGLVKMNPYELSLSDEKLSYMGDFGSEADYKLLLRERGVDRKDSVLLNDPIRYELEYLGYGEFEYLCRDSAFFQDILIAIGSYKFSATDEEIDIFEAVENADIDYLRVFAKDFDPDKSIDLYRKMVQIAGHFKTFLLVKDVIFPESYFLHKYHYIYFIEDLIKGISNFTDSKIPLEEKEGYFKGIIALYNSLKINIQSYNRELSSKKGRYEDLLKHAALYNDIEAFEIISSCMMKDFPKEEASPDCIDGSLNNSTERGCLDFFTYIVSTKEIDINWQLLLISAAKGGNLEMVEHIASLGGSREEYSSDDFTEILENGNLKIAKYLLEDMKLEVLLEGSISNCSASGNLETLKYLFAKLDESVEEIKESALSDMLVEYVNDLEVFKFIGAKFFKSRSFSEAPNPLTCLTTRFNPDIVRHVVQLIESKDFNTNITYADRISFLESILRCSDMSVLRYLMENFREGMINMLDLLRVEISQRDWFPSIRVDQIKDSSKFLKQEYGLDISYLTTEYMEASRFLRRFSRPFPPMLKDDGGLRVAKVGEGVRSFYGTMEERESSEYKMERVGIP